MTSAVEHPFVHRVLDLFEGVRRARTEPVHGVTESARRIGQRPVNLGS